MGFARSGGTGDDFARALVREGVRGGTASTMLPGVTVC